MSKSPCRICTKKWIWRVELAPSKALYADRLARNRSLAAAIADADNITRLECLKCGQDLGNKGEQVVEVRCSPLQYHQCNLTITQPLLVL